MNVQVRHSLAYSIVDRNESAFRIQCRFHRSCQKLSLYKYRPREIDRQFHQRYMMLAWAQQHMPRKQRMIIQKRYAILVFVDNVGIQVSTGDLTEHTLWIFHAQYVNARC